MHKQHPNQTESHMKQVSCCIDCCDKIGNQELENLWLNLCKMVTFHDVDLLECDETKVSRKLGLLKKLEMKGYIKTLDQPEKVLLKVQGHLKTNGMDTYCIDRLQHSKKSKGPENTEAVPR